jgi:hypothetical protein
VPQNIYLQLLRYLLAIYTRHQEKGGLLDVVIPVVIYHGKQAWQRRQLFEYFALPRAALRKFIPGFHYELIDLNQVADNLMVRLRRGYLLRNAFALMKYQHKQGEFREDFYKNGLAPY